jgi:CheY-like chemotaxis protein
MSERRKLMIIDDDPVYVGIIRALLEEAGYEIEVAYNPRDGLAALRARPHDLLLLDLLMARGAEGVTVARTVRADPALKRLPILVITGIQAQLSDILPGRAVRADEIPLDDLLEKTVRPEVLLDHVAALLEPAGVGR